MPRKRDKLTAQDAIHIYSVWLPYEYLVKQFGVTKTTVSDIKHGKRWKQATAGFELAKCHTPC